MLRQSVDLHIVSPVATSKRQVRNTVQRGNRVSAGQRLAVKLAALAGVSLLALGVSGAPALAQSQITGSRIVVTAGNSSTFLKIYFHSGPYDYGFELVPKASLFGASAGVVLMDESDTTGSPQTLSEGLRTIRMSGDGSTVGISSADTLGNWEAALWTKESGFRRLGFLNGLLRSDIRAISYDGTAVAGTASGSGAYSRAFFWKNGDGSLKDLGTLPGELNSFSSGMSGNGRTVIGVSGDSGFVWTVGDTSLTALGTLGGYELSPEYVSFDGDVIAGNISTSNNAFRWTTAGGAVSIGNFTSTAMSRNGDVIVGEIFSGNAARWVVDAGGINGTMTDLGTLDGSASTATAVSDDGSVVVGYSYGAGSSRGFRWTAEDGMISVEDWLRDNGITVAQDFARNVGAVSGDGTVLSGSTFDGDRFIARSTGIVTLQEYLASVASVGNVVTGQTIGSANNIMFGAQGSPMRNRLAAGQRSLFGTVDTGYDDSASSEGAVLLGDFGFGYGISDEITVRLSAGVTHADQDLAEGGDYTSNGWYVAPEVSANLWGPLYLTVGGLYAESALEINRGYLKGTATDFSAGETDSVTYAGKIRLDWLNAFSLEETSFSPYLALSRTHSRADAYTETGGAFPASYDETSDHSTVARIGLDAARPLTETITLLARAELAYRFEQETAATSGQITGLSSFDIAGQDVKQAWVRGGIGAEMAAAGGTASLMLNATTEGDDTDVWLRSGWKVDF